MKTYDVEVLETIVIHRLYKVEAETEDEAEDKAATGETVEEYDITNHGVINREIAQAPKEVKPSFYSCGICGAYHEAAWNGDCRQDDARFDPDQLDKDYGLEGWKEVPMPEGQWSQYGK